MSVPTAHVEVDDLDGSYTSASPASPAMKDDLMAQVTQNNSTGDVETPSCTELAQFLETAVVPPPPDRADDDPPKFTEKDMLRGGKGQVAFFKMLGRKDDGEAKAAQVAYAAIQGVNVTQRKAEFRAKFARSGNFTYIKKEKVHEESMEHKTRAIEKYKFSREIRRILGRKDGANYENKCEREGGAMRKWDPIKEVWKFYWDEDETTTDHKERDAIVTTLGGNKDIPSQASAAASSGPASGDTQLATTGTKGAATDDHDGAPPATEKNNERSRGRTTEKDSGGAGQRKESRDSSGGADEDTEKKKQKKVVTPINGAYMDLFALQKRWEALLPQVAGIDQAIKDDPEGWDWAQSKATKMRALKVDELAAETQLMTAMKWAKQSQITAQFPTEAPYAEATARLRPYIEKMEVLLAQIRSMYEAEGNAAKPAKKKDTPSKGPRPSRPAKKRRASN